MKKSRHRRHRRHLFLKSSVPIRTSVTQSKRSSLRIGANPLLSTGSNRQQRSPNTGYIPLGIEINMEFSEEVIKRARILIGRYVVMDVDLKGLSAINHWNRILVSIQDMEPINQSKFDKWTQRVTELNQRLKSIDVTDDRSAMAYMGEIEPKYDLYLEAYDRLVARHNQEKEELLASFIR
jgi:hypothetical protein